MTNTISTKEPMHGLFRLMKESNSRGLTTKFCCSRHSRQTRLRIMFNEDIDSEVLFKWNKELKHFNTRYNGRLTLSYSQRKNARFVGSWELNFEDNTTGQKQAVNTIWRIADYIQPKKRVDSHETQETY